MQGPSLCAWTILAWAQCVMLKLWDVLGIKVCRALMLQHNGTRQCELRSCLAFVVQKAWVYATNLPLA